VALEQHVGGSPHHGQLVAIAAGVSQAGAPATVRISVSSDCDGLSRGCFHYAFIGARPLPFRCHLTVRSCPFLAAGALAVAMQNRAELRENVEREVVTPGGREW